MTQLFSINLETGDLSQFDATQTDGGDLSAAGAAALHGSYGLSALIDDTNYIYGAMTFADKTEFRIRIYLDPNSVSMPDTGTLNVIETYDSTYTLLAMYCNLYYTIAGGYLIGAGDNAGGSYVSISTSLTDEPHCIEIYWKAATGPGNNDGILRLWVDDSLIGEETTVDSDDETIGGVLMGALYMTASTAGTIYMDDMTANDDGSKIGLYSAFVPQIINII